MDSGSDNNFFQGKTILVTGAAGTIGRVLIEALLSTGLDRLIALDHNETETYFVEGRHGGDPRFHAIVGDVRDYDKLQHVMAGVHVVFHGAALKHVTICERAPFDAVQTNILGVKNVINAAITNGVERLAFMSSDKAVNPSSVMGTSKLMGERLITAANTLGDGRRTIFTSTRFGNVLGSRGSALRVFEDQIHSGGPVTLTDERMTRFVMSPRQAVDLVMESAALAHGGEVFVTKMPVVRILDLARAAIDLLAPASGYDPGAIAIETVGVRPGEKLYEELLNEEEVRRTIELHRYFVVLPAFPNIYAQIEYDYSEGVGHDVNRIYRSDKEVPMSPEGIRAFLLEHRLLEPHGA